MNKKSGQRTPISKRLFALLLCCVCLLGVIPLAAIATRAEETQPVTIAETTVTEAATEAATEGVMAAAETEPTGTEPGDTLPTETVAEETVPSGTEAKQETEAAETTEPSTEPSEPTETTDPAATEETVDPVKALYDSLMECTTLEQVNAILYPQTEEEQAAVDALVEQFSEEQNAALSAKMEELGSYDAELLDDTSVEQGQSLTYTGLNSYFNDTYKVLKDGNEINASAFGITVKFSDNGTKLTVQTTESTPAGDYVIQYGKMEKFFFWEYFEQAGELKLTVTAKQENVPVTNTKQMTYNKTVTRNNSGKYDLELTLSGAVGTKNDKAKVDLVIVIDNSGSMYNERIEKAKTAAKSLINTLADNEKIDAQYSVVLFSGTRGHDYSGEKGYEKATATSGWGTSTSATTYVEKITSNSTNGSATNYEAGLRTAQDQVNLAREGSTKIVIFLTDGVPTLRVSGRDDKHGNKYDDGYNGFGNGEDDNSDKNIKAAKNYAATMTMNQFYVIGFGNANEQNMKDLANAATNASVKYYKKGSDSDLTKIFDEIAGKISNFFCDHVTITDTLSHVDGELMVKVTDPSTVKVKVLKEDGTVVAGPAASVNLAKTSYNAEATLTTEFNEKDGVLKLNFPESYKLEPDYTYVLCAEIEPTEKAYQEYRESGYTNLGDANTGTHSGQVGFYSNDQAKVDYQYDGSTGSVTYDKPVVQLNPGKLVVTKTVTGLTDEQITGLAETLKFKIKLTYPIPTAAQEVEVPLSAFTPNTDGTYSYTISGLSPNTAYTVEEIGAEIDGMSLTKTVTGSESGTVSKGQTVIVGYTNAYTMANTSVTINKIVDGNVGVLGQEFPFTVTVDKKMTAGTYEAKGGSVAYTVADDGEGSKITFKLAHGQKVVLQDVPIGAKLVVTESGNVDYQVSVGNTILKNQNVNSDASYTVDSVTKDMNAITFTNTKEVTIETGVSLETLPYILILAVVAVGAVVMIRKRRNRDED